MNETSTLLGPRDVLKERGLDCHCQAGKPEGVFIVVVPLSALK